MMTLADALPHGTSLKGGEYRIGKVLKRGGFGIIYLGSQPKIQMPVAIKELFPPGGMRDRDGLRIITDGSMSAQDFEAYRNAIREEANFLSQFNDTGIVSVKGCFSENNTVYLVMEYLRGKTLADSDGTLAEEKAIEIIEKAGQALKAVHAKKALHLDVKPENIMLTEDGRVVLIDFGSALAIGAEGENRTTLLTEGFAPLEQYGKKTKLGPSTDIYALGATLYHLLTGKPPVSASDRATGVEIPPVRKLNPRVSEGAERAVMNALRMKMEERPKCVAEWLDSLRNPPESMPLPEPPSQTKPVPPPIPQPSPEMEWRVLSDRIQSIIIFSIIFSIIVGGLILLTYYWNHPGAGYDSFPPK